MTGSPAVMSMYRADIDGLRAIAVSLVVTFHYFPTVLPGGYIGVDVFFVISGYLISQQIIEQLRAQKFAVSRFWVRRARRLLPALLAMLAVSSVLAYLFLYPKDLYNYAKILLWQSVSGQNVALWLMGDYFDAADTKPLLHTWSLAVEEQFYVVWPIVLAFIARRYAASVMWVLGLVLLGSLGLGWILAQSTPKTAFYLLPTRMCELLAGCMLAWMFATRTLSSNAKRPLSELAALGGIVMIIAAATLYDGSTPFPGWQALLAMLGTMCLISSRARSDTAVSRVLSNTALVGVGLRSYSLYLWHWPLLSIGALALGFARIAAMPVALRCAALVLAIAAATGSYKWIEQPLRRRRALPDDAGFVTACVGGLIALALFAIISTQTRGASFRYPQPARAYLEAQLARSPYRCSYLNRLLDPLSEICRINDASGTRGILLYGDSHADAVDEVFATVAQGHDVRAFLNKRNCGLRDDGGRDGSCGAGVWESVLHDIKVHRIGEVILVSYWSERVTARFLEERIQSLLESGVAVHILKVVPASPTFDPERIARQLLQAPRSALPFETIEEHERASRGSSAAIEAASAAHPALVSVHDPAAYLCRSGKCRGEEDGVPLYFDTNHLTPFGARKLTPLFQSIISANVKCSSPPRTSAAFAARSCRSPA